MGSTVISIRIDEELKRDLEALAVDYPTLVKSYLQEIVRREKLKRALQEADGIREELSKKYGSFSSSADLIREDRDIDDN